MIAYIMTGLPATGKSTLRDELVTPATWTISTDDYIETIAEEQGLTYSEVFQSVIKEATQFEMKRFEQAMDLGIPLVWDQTNLGREKRMKAVRKLKDHDFEVVSAYIEQPTKLRDLLEWRRRLQSRPGKTIPDYVILGMQENYQHPTLDEGFDKILKYDMYGRLVSTINND